MSVSHRKTHRENLTLREAYANSSWVRGVRIRTARSQAPNPTVKFIRRIRLESEINASPHELRLGICSGSWKDLQRLRKRSMPLVVVTSRLHSMTNVKACNGLFSEVDRLEPNLCR